MDERLVERLAKRLGKRLDERLGERLGEKLEDMFGLVESLHERLGIGHVYRSGELQVRLDKGC